jgi:hypothetical protein
MTETNLSSHEPVEAGGLARGEPTLAASLIKYKIRETHAPLLTYAVIIIKHRISGHRLA